MKVVWLVVVGVVLALMVAEWNGINALFGAEDPEPEELRMPWISNGDARSFVVGRSTGTLEQSVFSVVGRGEPAAERTDVAEGTPECYLWRVEGADPNRHGHFPLWRLCFDGDSHRLVHRGRFRDA